MKQDRKLGMATSDHTHPRADRRILSGENKFKLGVFGANASGGVGGISQVEGQLALHDWSEVSSLAQKADKSGVEAYIPIARWKSIQGPGHAWDRQFETFTWAAGLAAATEQMQIFVTCHVPFVHPILAAKMAATVDHITNGRLGVNVVAGFYEPEFKMFGQALRNHDERYRVADEWMGLVKRLWSESDPYQFDHEGEYYKLTGAESFPKPVQDPYPVVMSAGASPAGQQFAFDNADILFMAIQDAADAKSVIEPARKEADKNDRQDLSLWAMVHLVCRDTEREAWDYVRYYAEEKADWEAAAKLKEILLGGDARSISQYKDDLIIQSLVRGSNATPIVGTPEQVVEIMLSLSEAGLNGAGVGMVDYDEGIDRLTEQVIPLMKSAGLRSS